MAERTVYLDNSATTRLKGEVLDAMMPYFSGKFGNPSSLHTAGQDARKAIESTREKVVGFIGASSNREVIFTSGGTESDNIAIKASLEAGRKKNKKHIISSPIEHHAIIKTLQALKKAGGCELDLVPVNEKGIVKVKELEKLIREDTCLITIMLANNEIGTIQPIKEICEIAAKHKIPVHTDAVQALGKIPINVEELGISMLSASAHKFHGPKGIGLLYVKLGTPFTKQQTGGHHEWNRRAGTENVPGIIGFTKALELSVMHLDENAKKMSALRDRLEKGILEKVPETYVNGDTAKRLPNLSNIGFRYVEGEGIILSLDAEGISVASGSACTSETLDPSHVLTAMGVSPEHAHGSIRFSLSTDITEKDIDYTISKVTAAIERLRAMSPLYKQDAGGGGK
ncbi:MAG: aminotransferase class V-fold PLP-dependent enzyme [Planctomycetota bacterium]|nr:MAG: aminotransferase class V-fold PLP-dependent enzyme [Planctomycetota bacterium]